MTNIYIARHGNTFEPNMPVVRVGCKTDIPLAKKGKLQAVDLANFFARQDLNFDAIYTSCLQRTKMMAEIICNRLNWPIGIVKSNQIFNEIDYGMDEGKTDEQVIARIGANALKDWDTNAIVPDGWNVDPLSIISNWQEFANSVKGKNVLVITSNGIARFALCITEEQQHNISLKVATGNICCLSYASSWSVKFWNKNPTKTIHYAN